MPNATFLGGPCAGQQSNVSDADIAAGVTVCRAVQYRLERVGPDTLYAVAPDQGEVSSDPTLPAVPTGDYTIIRDTLAVGGWNEMLHAASVGLGGGLQAVNVARRHIRGI